jgi:proline dehydrogenase
LVKGAYSEPPEIAFPEKSRVDENYFLLAEEMLLAKKAEPQIRAAFGTHDLVLLRRISEFAAATGLRKAYVEVQMLYGIQSGEQERLAREGYSSRVLVSYGSHWYTWFVRRLAERPANLWFVARNLFHFR